MRGPTQARPASARLASTAALRLSPPHPSPPLPHHLVREPKLEHKHLLARRDVAHEADRKGVEARVHLEAEDVGRALRGSDGGGKRRQPVLLLPSRREREGKGRGRRTWQMSRSAFSISLVKQ